MFDEVLRHVLVDSCIDVSASGYRSEHFPRYCLAHEAIGPPLASWRLSRRPSRLTLAPPGPHGQGDVQALKEPSDSSCSRTESHPNGVGATKAQVPGEAMKVRHIAANDAGSHGPRFRAEGALSHRLRESVRLSTRTRSRSARVDAGRGRRSQTPRPLHGSGATVVPSPQNVVPCDRQDQQGAFRSYERGDVLGRDPVLSRRHRLHGQILDNQIERTLPSRQEGPGHRRRRRSLRCPGASAAPQRSRSARSRTRWSDIPARRGTRHRPRNRNRPRAPHDRAPQVPRLGPLHELGTSSAVVPGWLGGTGLGARVDRLEHAQRLVRHDSRLPTTLSGGTARRGPRMVKLLPSQQGSRCTRLCQGTCVYPPRSTAANFPLLPDADVSV